MKKTRKIKKTLVKKILSNLWRKNWRKLMKGKVREVLNPIVKIKKQKGVILLRRKWEEEITSIMRLWKRRMSLLGPILRERRLRGELRGHYWMGTILWDRVMGKAMKRFKRRNKNRVVLLRNRKRRRSIYILKNRINWNRKLLMRKTLTFSQKKL